MTMEGSSPSSDRCGRAWARRRRRYAYWRGALHPSILKSPQLARHIFPIIREVSRCFVAILVVAHGKTPPDRPDPVVDLGLVASLLLRDHLALEATQCVLVLAQGVDRRVHLPPLNGVSQYAFHNTRYRGRAPRVGRARTRLILRRKSHR